MNANRTRVVAVVVIVAAFIALTAFALFTHIPGAAVEAVALAVWLGVSLLLYLLIRRLFR